MFDAALCLDGKFRLLHDPVVVEIFPHAADGVAAHIPLAAVRIEHTHLCVRNFAGADEDDAVPADPLVPVRKAHRRAGRIGKLFLQAIEIDIIVARTVHFCKLFQHTSSRFCYLTLVCTEDLQGDLALGKALVHRLLFNKTVRVRFRHVQVLNERALGSIDKF